MLRIDNVVKKGITVSRVPVNSVADDFLKHYAPVATETSIWRGGEIKLVYPPISRTISLRQSS